MDENAVNKQTNVVCGLLEKTLYQITDEAWDAVMIKLWHNPTDLRSMTEHLVKSLRRPP